ncbi:hypothetical protein BVRB_7g172250 [Beta vulgaris subsp. vulgaris]|nr:hypothetical protein BVRB_7g172250 [Beta vulgaris subsp. vulgaris]
MPRHLAVIMDGNVRWARKRGLHGSKGHEAGVEALRNMVELCGKWGIKVLTIFAFSCDNWSRSKVSNFTKPFFVPSLFDLDLLLVW